LVEKVGEQLKTNSVKTSRLWRKREEERRRSAVRAKMKKERRGGMVSDLKRRKGRKFGRRINRGNRSDTRRERKKIRKVDSVWKFSSKNQDWQKTPIVD